MSKTAWEKGVYLWQAPRHFTYQHTRERLDKLRDENSITNTLGRTLQQLQKLGNGIEHLGKAWADSTSSQAELYELEAGLKDNLLYYLQQGELLAYGFASPRAPEDEPKRVPQDLLHKTNFNWDKNIIQGNGLHFEAVRIVRTSWLLTEQPKQAGRPSSAQNVLESYNHLHAIGQLPFTSLHKAAKAIQKHLFVTVLNEDEQQKGYSIPTIENHIREKFNSDKTQ